MLRFHARTARQMQNLRTRNEQLAIECEDLKEENMRLRGLEEDNEALRDEIDRQAGFHQGLSDAFKQADEQRNQFITEKHSQDQEIRKLQGELSQARDRDEEILRLKREIGDDHKKDNEIRRLQEETARVALDRDEKIRSLKGSAKKVIQEQNDNIRRLQKDAMQVQKKDDDLRKLQREIVQYKTAMTTSNQVEGQLSDATIRGKIDGLFFAVRDWALNVVHEGNLGKS